ncbi:hypothetical protein NLG97_g7132 [Lecanicillium saksenae]|uniref:Uncharacterized protein n=1 Tax=Lecanicillium saksenae TaxID=468837 RepID=A0ACC1QQ89_9HYPO|nr:hypothetical protein NLG97_g7132 [Lecanicillium saksenae]
MEHKEEHARGLCENVGEGMADMVGIGIIVGFVGQALLSLILAFWVFFMTKHGRLNSSAEHGTIEWKIQQKRLTFVSEMLMIGNDIQLGLGISYMITAFTQSHTMDLYHLRLIFDIVCFVGVSSAAALVCWSFCAMQLPDIKKTVVHPRHAFWTVRHRVTYAFAAMFVGLTILLMIRLGEWNLDAEPGRCYHTAWTTRDDASHPVADRVYVGITAAWILVTMASSIWVGARHRRWILSSTILQFPVHLYMAIALRTANQGKLSGEEVNENAWDFGQTTAVVLLAMAVGELYRKGREFLSFERALRKSGHVDVEDRDIELQLKPRGSQSAEEDEMEDVALNREPPT